MRSMRTNNNSSKQTERSLNTSNTFSTATKAKYPKCEVKKQHQKDILNLVCLSSNCKSKGVLCSMCKAEEHSKHHVMPVKTFLAKVRDSYRMRKQEHMMEPIQRQKINGQALSNYKNEMLTALNFHITTLAQHIQLIQQKIIKECQQLTNTLFQQQHMKNNLQSVVQELMDNIPEQQNIYRKQINTIIDLLQIKPDTSFSFDTHLDDKLQAYKKKNQNFQINIENWVNSSISQLNTVFNDIVVKAPPTAQNNAVRFLSDLKPKGIVLSSENKVAKQTNYNTGKVCLLNTSNIKEKSMAIKVSSLSTNVCVGVCLKDVIKSNSYKWNQASLGHGTFMLAKNSYTYSHNDKNENMMMKGFGFNTGDQIGISVKGNEVHFKKKNDPKANSTLSLKNLTEDNWKQLSFCVCLNGNGDKVELVDNF